MVIFWSSFMTLTWRKFIYETNLLSQDRWKVNITKNNIYRWNCKSRGRRFHLTLLILEENFSLERSYNQRQGWNHNPCSLAILWLLSQGNEAMANKALLYRQNSWAHPPVYDLNFMEASIHWQRNSANNISEMMSHCMLCIKKNHSCLCLESFVN